LGYVRNDHIIHAVAEWFPALVVLPIIGLRDIGALHIHDEQCGLGGVQDDVIRFRSSSIVEGAIISLPVHNDLHEHVSESVRAVQARRLHFIQVVPISSASMSPRGRRMRTRIIATANVISVSPTSCQGRADELFSAFSIERRPSKANVTRKVPSTAPETVAAPPMTNIPRMMNVSLR